MTEFRSNQPHLPEGILPSGDDLLRQPSRLHAAVTDPAMLLEEAQAQANEMGIEIKPDEIVPQIEALESVAINSIVLPEALAQNAKQLKERVVPAVLEGVAILRRYGQSVDSDESKAVGRGLGRLREDLGMAQQAVRRLDSMARDRSGREVQDAGRSLMALGQFGDTYRGAHRVIKTGVDYRRQAAVGSRAHYEDNQGEAEKAVRYATTEEMDLHNHPKYGYNDRVKNALADNEPGNVEEHKVACEAETVKVKHQVGLISEGLDKGKQGLDQATKLARDGVSLADQLPRVSVITDTIDELRLKIRQLQGGNQQVRVLAQEYIGQLSRQLRNVAATAEDLARNDHMTHTHAEQLKHASVKLESSIYN